MPKVVFPSMKVFVEKTLFSLVQKTLVEYFQLALAACNLAIYIFILFSDQIVFDNLIIFKLSTFDKKLEKLQVQMNHQILDVLLPFKKICKDLIKRKVIKC
jgi:hypothetical protein